MKKKTLLLIVVVLIFLNIFAVSAQDNETVIGDDYVAGDTVGDDISEVNETESPALSIETSVSNDTIYIGNSTEVIVTVKNLGNCDIDTLSIVNLNSLYTVNYELDRFMTYGDFNFGDSVDNYAFNYDSFESINGSWYCSHYSRYTSFILNDTLNPNQSFSIRVIFSTNKIEFQNYVNVNFFAFLDNITFPYENFFAVKKTMLNRTKDKIWISQIPRTVYVNRSIQNGSLIVDAKISSLDNSNFSGNLSIKVADLVTRVDETPRKVFEKAEINFINNTGNATLKLPLNITEQYITGLIVGIPKYDVYSYEFVYDSFDESQIQPPLPYSTITIDDEMPAPAVSIETSISNPTIYIGNSTEAIVTVKNVGNCNINTLSIVNSLSVFELRYDDGINAFLATGEGDFSAYIKNPEFHYVGFESINGSWYSSYVDDNYGTYLSFIMNDTLKVNQSFSFKVYYSTTKNDFHNFVNVYFFAFLDNITYPYENFYTVKKTMLNRTYDKIWISQIPRTVYVNRSIQNDSLIVDAKISSLDNSNFSGNFSIKVGDLVMPEDQYPKMEFEKAVIDFINNTGSTTLKLPLNMTEQYITGLIVGLPKYDVYSYNFVYDSFDESQIQPQKSSSGYVIIDLSFKTSDLVKIYKNDSQFVVDARETPYSNITFKVNGVSYLREVNESGYATLNINLRPGVYTIETSTQFYSVNNTITVLPTLIADNLVKYFKNDSQFEIKLIDSSNHPVASQNVTFNINGVFYSRQTDEDGIARLNINLAPGEYIVTATDPLTGLSMSYNITVLPLLYGEDIVSFYMGDYDYSVKLVDGEGNAVPGQSITFNINGYIYNRTTRDDGYAKLFINLMPGRYIVTAQYLDSKISNEIIIFE